MTRRTVRKSTSIFDASAMLQNVVIERLCKSSLLSFTNIINADADIPGLLWFQVNIKKKNLAKIDFYVDFKKIDGSSNEYEVRVSAFPHHSATLLCDERNSIDSMDELEIAFEAIRVLRRTADLVLEVASSMKIIHEMKEK